MTPHHALIRFCKEYRDHWQDDWFPSFDYFRRHGMEQDEMFVMLCHITQMPGHCMVIRLKDNKIYGPLHTEDFEDVPEDET